MYETLSVDVCFPVGFWLVDYRWQVRLLELTHVLVIQLFHNCIILLCHFYCCSLAWPSVWNYLSSICVTSLSLSLSQLGVCPSVAFVFRIRGLFLLASLCVCLPVPCSWWQCNLKSRPCEPNPDTTAQSTLLRLIRCLRIGMCTYWLNAFASNFLKLFLTPPQPCFVK